MTAEDLIMSTKVETLDNVTVITPYLSRATLDHASDFKEYVMTTIDIGQNNLVIDLSLCDFIDSTFLGVLVVSLKKVSLLNRKLVLVLTGDIPLGMFRETKMDKVFTIFTNLEEAVKKMKNNHQ